MDEMVDVVDEQTKTLYQISKGEAHKKGLLHKTVVSNIIDSKGNWVLVRQAPDRQDAGKFVYPVGGHVTAGETNEEALAREANEEVGFTEINSNFKKRFIYYREVLERIENHFFIFYEILNDQDLILGNEAVDFKRFNVDELKKEVKEFPDHFGKAFFAVTEAVYPDLLKP